LFGSTVAQQSGIATLGLSRNVNREAAEWRAAWNRKRFELIERGGQEDVEMKSGTAKCYLREQDGHPPCCPSIDLECFGCNQDMLNQGIPCIEQTTDILRPVHRDCFCDSSCILFNDCCSDHKDTCSSLYTTTTPEPTTTTEFTTRILTTTALIDGETKATTKATTTQSKKTKKPVTKLPDDDELITSWIFKKLFDTLKRLIREKYKGLTTDKTKFAKMLNKMGHIHKFMINGELNCRREKAPLIGEPYDPKFDEFDYVWDGTKKEAGTYEQRTNVLTNGFMKYIGDYYFDAETTQNPPKQGCDGQKLTGFHMPQRGVHFKMKRVTRKVSKAIYKVTKRRTHPAKSGPNNQYKLAPDES